MDTAVNTPDTSKGLEASKDQQAEFKMLDTSIRTAARNTYFSAKEFATFVAQAYAAGELFWKFHGRTSWDEYAADVFAKEVPADMGKGLRDALIAELHEAKLSTRKIQKITGTSTGTTARAIKEHARKAAGAQLAKSGSEYKTPAPRTVSTTPATPAAAATAMLEKVAAKWSDFDTTANGWKVSFADLEALQKVLTTYAGKVGKELDRRDDLRRRRREHLEAELAEIAAADEAKSRADHPTATGNNRNPRIAG